MVKRWPKWYLDDINDKFQYLSEDQRSLARKATELFKQSVEVSVINTRHLFSGTPLPEGYVNNSNDILLEAISIYESIGMEHVVRERQLECYQCEKLVPYLFPDSRCKDCTRITPDELTGGD